MITARSLTLLHSHMFLGCSPLALDAAYGIHDHNINPLTLEIRPPVALCRVTPTGLLPSQSYDSHRSVLGVTTCKLHQKLQLVSS